MSYKPRLNKAKAKPKPELPKGIDSTYELVYVNELEGLKRLGLIRNYYIKPGSLRLGTGSHYEPDFMVISEDGVVEYHEVKGATRFAQKSLTKIKAAAHQYQDLMFLLCMGQKQLNPDTGKKELVFEITEIS